MSEEAKKPIDKVTVVMLDIALRMCGISLNLNDIDIILDVVELLEDKEDQVTIKDIVELMQNHLNKL